MTNIIRALRHRNYRLFFSGQSISLVGTWMQQVALSWLVYRMTNSPFLLGVVGFTSQVPSALVAPFAGVIADRYNRRRLLLMTQVCAMGQASALAILVLTHQITIKQIIFLSGLLGLINAFDIPIRQSFTVEMIEKKEDLGNAIALNSSIVNLAKLLGPTMAGILIPAVGEGMCFLLNAVSYIAVIYAITAMQVPHKQIKPSRHPIFRELNDGVHYAFSSIPIRSILLLLGLMSFSGGFLQTLMPVFAKDIFLGGSRTLGFLIAASGFGALLGAVYLASRKSVIGLSKIIAFAAAVFSLSVLLLALSRNLFFSAGLMISAGFSVMVEMASSNTILQTIVEEDKRGRIMSLFTVAFIGMAPFGSFIAGTLAGRLSAPGALFVAGAACMAATVFFFRQLPQIRAHIRPIYAQKGIIPTVLPDVR